MMKTRYFIVPIDDGYHYLAIKDGKFYLQHKAEQPHGYPLIFKTEKEANDYIKMWELDIDKYVPEAFYINEGE